MNDTDTRAGFVSTANAPGTGVIQVCPLSRLEATARSSGAQDVVTLMTRGSFKMPCLDVGRHLWLELSDITEASAGYALPQAGHLADLLHFAQAWDRRRPLLVHCYAGVSRSTAAAFLLACALQPQADEGAIAARLRALSPTATPNPRIIALADAMLGRSGRMIRAVEAIGRGEDCFEGVPFGLEIADQIPPYQS